MSENTFAQEQENFFDEKKENAVPVIDTVKSIPFEVKLSRPLKIGSNTIEKLVISKYPKIGMLAHLPTSPEMVKNGHYFPLLADVCEVPRNTIEELSPVDFENLLSEMLPFL